MNDSECRYCWESTGTLCRPCKCRSYIHASCVRTYMESMGGTRCPECKSNYNFPFEWTSVHILKAVVAYVCFLGIVMDCGAPHEDGATFVGLVCIASHLVAMWFEHSEAYWRSALCKMMMWFVISELPYSTAISTHLFLFNMTYNAYKIRQPLFTLAYLSIALEELRSIAQFSDKFPSESRILGFYVTTLLSVEYAILQHNVP